MLNFINNQWNESYAHRKMLFQMHKIDKNFRCLVIPSSSKIRELQEWWPLLGRRYTDARFWKTVLFPVATNSTPQMGELLHVRLCLIFTAIFGGIRVTKKWIIRCLPAGEGTNIWWPIHAMQFYAAENEEYIIMFSKK